MDYRIQQVPAQVMIPKKVMSEKLPVKGERFDQVLKQKQNQLTLSKHAEERLLERHIKIDESKWQQIADHVEKARTKGITDSLVLTNEAALVVSAKNHTVITAMAREDATDRIFTNINGTILID